jgi:hypothetical protein
MPLGTSIFFVLRTREVEERLAKLTVGNEILFGLKISFIRNFQGNFTMMCCDNYLGTDLAASE